MSNGPPFAPDDSTSDWDDWREETTSLDYPDRDIRVIFPEQTDRRDIEVIQPADFGDFNPQPDDPDPDVWPLEELDPGAPASIHDLFLIQDSFPAPHVAWVTEEYLIERYGYNAVRVEIDVDIEALPPWRDPDNVSDDGTVEIVAPSNYDHPMTMTDARTEALRRFANLWNGQTVRGHHLLLDKCPGWLDIFGDLDQDELQRLVVGPSANPELAEAFSEYEWYNQSQNVYMSPKRILRKKVWYAPTQRGRSLINNRVELPDLNGDPNEGLVHRFTVGLAALRELLSDRKIGTYYDYEGYTVDIMSQDDDGQLYAGEVMTDHNNWQLHRDTHRKLADLNSDGIIPYVVFDSRSTAYKIFNHWHSRNLAQLPRGQFNSAFGISDGQKRIREAYEDDEYYWIVSDWKTTSSLWRNTLGQDGPEVDDEKITSYSW